MGIFSSLFGKRKIPVYVPPSLPPPKPSIDRCVQCFYRESIKDGECGRLNENGFIECSAGHAKYNRVIEEEWRKIAADAEEEMKNVKIPYWWDTEEPPRLSVNEKSFLKRIKKYKNWSLFTRTGLSQQKISELNIEQLQCIAAEMFNLDEWVINNDERLSKVIDYLDEIGIKSITPFSMFYFIQVANEILDEETEEPRDSFDIVEINNRASHLLGCSKDIAIDMLLPE